MKQNKLIFTILVFSIIALPGLTLAGNQVQDLKYPAKSMAEQMERFDAILAMGNGAVTDLVALIQEKDPTGNSRQNRDTKVTAMNLLSELKAEDALDVLARLLEDSDNLSMINNAARTIGRIGGDKAYTILTNALSDASDAKVVKAVIAGLGLCGDARAIPRLQAIREDTSQPAIVRIYAAGSLGLLGNQGGFATAMDALTADDPNIRLAAIRALGIIGAFEAVDNLMAIALGDSPYVFRMAASDAIVQINAVQMGDDAEADYIADQLEKNAGSTALIQWGTLKLKKMNNGRGKNALRKLAQKEGKGFAALQHAARVRAQARP